MKGVHNFIESDNKNEKENFIFIKENGDYKINTIYHVKTLPSFFYFSSDENANKANDILSKFFGLDIREWWYKG